MKKFALLSWVTLLCVFGFAAVPSGAKAQNPSETNTETEATPETISAVQPRFGVRYTTEGAGFDSFFNLEGFVPLFQDPGKNVTFLEGRVLLDSDSTMAGNLLLGHRFVSETGDRITGGYVSFDRRDTGNSLFNQLGVGIESLGNWDFRTNAYLPLGNAKNQVAAPFFSANSLLLPFESALYGFDAEVGTKLASLGQGDLRGYAGLYYYTGDQVDSLGWRARLEANPTNFLNLGLTVQNDSIFDTRAVFTVGLSFPGSGSSGRGSSERSRLLARMGESTDRQVIIPVKNTFLEAINPDTNEPWRFVHVSLGGNSNGTFESPYASIQQGVDNARNGDIVYVRLGNNSTTPGFTIPNNKVVQILTNGPIQTVNTTLVGPVVLPFSGRGGAFAPKLTGVLTLANNSVISGFNIDGALGGAIQGSNISNVTIQNNIIQNSNIDPNNTANLGNGVLLTNVTGKVNITDNTIRNNTETAISINNTAGSAELNITGNTISDNFNSIRANFLGTAQATGQIANNTISNPGIGVDVNVGGNAKLSNFNISGNTITAPTGGGLFQGINFTAADNANATVNIINNTVSNTENTGINAASFNDTTTVNLNIIGNTVTNTGAQGIYVDGLNGARNGNTVINKNTITSAFSEGIYLENVRGKVEINDNKVVNTRNPDVDTDLESGIFIWNYQGNIDLTIANNRIETNFAATDYRVDGIEFNLCRDVDPIYLGKPCTSAATANVNILNNTITHSGNVVGGGDGIDLNLGQFADAKFTITGNQISNIPDEGISINAVAESKGQFNISNNTIRNVVDSGIEVDLFLPDPTISAASNLFNRSNTQFTITGNTIDTTKNDGIDFDIQDQAQSKITIEGNTIRNIGDGETGDRAIQLETSNSSRMCTSINGNTISGAPNPSRLRPNGTSTLEVVDSANLSSRNGGANFVTTGTTNRNTPCP
jgi:Right handed beta helix region